MSPAVNVTTTDAPMATRRATSLDDLPGENKAQRWGGPRVEGMTLAGAALLYVVLTALLTYPLVLHPASTMVWMGPDSELFLWTFAWNAHAVVTNPLRIFDANIFHPLGNTLAYTENLIGSTLFAGPVLWLTGNHVLALNTVALSSVVLCGIGAYLLARQVGVGVAGSVLAGIVFAFSPPRFNRIGQMHLTTVQWMPFALAAFHRYLDGGRAVWLRVAIGLFTLQAWTSGHGAVFLLLAFVLLVGYRLGLGEPLAVARRLKDLGLTGVALLLPVFVLAWRYQMAQDEIGLRRSLDPNWWSEGYRYAAAFVATPAHLPRLLLEPIFGNALANRAVAYLFPGFVPLLLGAAALLGRPRVRAAMRRPAAGQAERRAIPWRRVAVGCAIVGVGLGLLAGHVAANGRIVLRTESSTVLSVRSPGRPALASLVLLACSAVAAILWRRGQPARQASEAGFPERRTLLSALLRRHAAWRAWGGQRRNDMVLFYALLTAVTVWFSSGAPFGPWPCLCRLPGFSLLRVPSRFTILSVLGLAVLSGFGFDHLARRFGRPGSASAPAAGTPGLPAPARRGTALAFGIGVLLVAEFAMIPLDARFYQAQVPAVDRWLAGRPTPFVVAEMPARSDRDHTAYMLHSTAHWQRTIDGYSGFRPQLHHEANKVLRGFPSPASLDTLERLGVDYVVVHPARYPPGGWNLVKGRLPETAGRLRLEHTDGLDLVYSLQRGNSPPARPARSREGIGP